ncbi:MAG TPA: trypsin-like peptidase domain-containing protein [Thermoleophilaceae bacterium]|nr:trypsin-like peptidase domain-containing protein [Thermoleophilaceae bacterium]
MWLVIESGPSEGRSVRIRGERVTIGSAPDCDLRVEHDDVEPHHATIVVGRDGHLELRDEGSREGVFVEGERVTEPVPLNGDERVRLGNDVLLALSMDEPAAEPMMEVPVRRWRTVAGALRRTRRTVRIALAAAGAALAVAVGLGVLLLTGVIGDDEAERGRSVADVVERAAPSTVLVRTRVGRSEATGSGFALDTRDGLVVTNFHVINGGRTFDVRVGEDFRPAEVVGAAPCDDLALLRLEDTDGLSSMALGSQGDLKQGQEVVALGFPANPSLRGELTSTAGVVSVPRSSFRLPTPDSPHFENLIQTDAALNPGNSGGPLVDSEARLVGVNTAIYAQARGPSSTQGYAIGVDRVKEVVAELREGRSQRWLGAGLSPPPERLLRRLGARGLLVTSAVPGTAAAEVGLEGVLLTTLNGTALDGTIAGYCAAVEGLESGDSVEAEVIVSARGAPRAITLELD